MLQPLDDTFWRRLAVTAAVLAAFRLGTQLPLPGLDADQVARLFQAGGSSIERVSILSLGVMPLVNALLLFEVLKLAAPGVRTWELAAPRNRDRMRNILVGVTLLMALLQGLGVSTALEEVRNLVAQPGSGFRLVATITLVAGTAVVIAFAAVIDRAGLGQGIWLLFLAPALAELPYAVERLAGVYAGGRDVLEPLVLVACTVIAVAGVVSIVLAAGAARSTVAACLWIPLITNAAVLPLLLGLGWLATYSADDALTAATPGHPAWYFATAIGVVLVTSLYLKSIARAGTPSPVPALPMAAVLAAILIAWGMLPLQLGVALPLSSTELIIAAAIATALLVQWGRANGREATGAPSEADQSSGLNR